MSVERGSSPLDGLSTEKSAGYGAVAYAVGYAIFFVLEGSRVSRDISEAFGGGGSSVGQYNVDPPSTFEIVGWMFYVAHNAGIKISVTAMGRSQSFSTNPGFADKTYLLLIPPAILVTTGYLVASRETSPGDSLPATGASIAVGYLILSIVGVFAFRWNATVTGGFGQEATLAVGPELLPGAFIIGVAYPVVFGGLGGLIAQETSDRGTVPHARGGRAGHPPGGGQQPGGHQHRQGHQNQRPPADRQGSGQPHGQGGTRPRRERQGPDQRHGNRQASGPPAGNRSSGDRTGDDRPGA